MSMIDIIIYEILSMSFFKSCFILSLGTIVFLAFPILIYKFLKDTLKTSYIILSIAILTSIPTVIYIYIEVKILYILVFK